VEGKFSEVELLLYGVLGSSHTSGCKKFTYSMMRPSSPVAMMPLLLQEEVRGWLYEYLQSMGLFDSGEHRINGLYTGHRERGRRLKGR
jgi:hypothetical protein